MQLSALIKLIPASLRKRSIAVALAIPVKALLNFVGLAALLPLLLLVLSDGVQSQSWMLKIYDFFGFTSSENFALALCISVFVLLLLKNGVNILLGLFQNKFLLKLYSDFSSRLFNNYYQQGLPFISSQNLTALMHDVNYTCYAFSFNVLSPLFSLFGEALFLIFVYAALLIYNIKASLLLPLCFVPVFIFYMLVFKRKLKEYGQQENQIRREQARTVYESFKGYTSIEINQAFPKMQQDFSDNLERICNLREKTGFISMLPAILGELSIALCLILMLLFFKPDSSMRLLFGVFALAAIRILPSLSKIINSWTSVRNGQYHFDIISKAIDKTDHSSEQTSQENAVNFTREISAQNICFAFEPGHPLINNYSFTIAKGEHLGIQGPSGIGKTTLYNLLLGFYSPDSGSICIDGIPLTPQNRSNWHKLIGYVPQEVFIAHASLAENIALGQTEIDRERVLKVLHLVCLDHLLVNLAQGIDTSMGDSGSRLSGGEKQRLGIARALYKGASVLFFDEATSSLDSRTEHEINKTIQELSQWNKSLTLISISHHRDTLKYCDRIIELE